MLQNGQTNFKNFAVRTPQDLKYVWPFCNIIHERVKRIKIVIFDTHCSFSAICSLYEFTYFILFTLPELYFMLTNVQNIHIKI